MSQQINLEQLDPNGDVREVAENAGVDRGTFLRNGAIAGAGVAGLGVFGLPSVAQATISTKKKSTKNDIKILNYALLLEYLEFSFYDEAVKADSFATPELKQFAQVVRAHEKAHVDFLKKGLGKAAIAVPKLNAEAVAGAISQANFAATAQALEDTGVTAYAGQGPNLKTRAFVVAALEIHSVEARHAAWIRFLNLPDDVNSAAGSALPAPKSFDKAKSQKSVLSTVTKTKLVRSFDASKI